MLWEFIIDNGEAEMAMFGMCGLHGEVFKMGKRCDVETKFVQVNVSGVRQR